MSKKKKTKADEQRERDRRFLWEPGDVTYTPPPTATPPSQPPRKPKRRGTR